MSLAQPTQLYRHLSVSTVLGYDKVLVRSVSLQEQLSRLFQFEVSLVSHDSNISCDQILGTNATIELELEDGDRYFNGFVSRFAWLRTERDYACYQMSLVPWFWFLTRTSDCRIFQNKSVPDIITEIFSDHGFSDFRKALSGNYSPWEYCVQYRETDFNFVSRLMEHEGIYYFFEHENGKHTLVLADSPTAHQPKEGAAEIIYRQQMERVHDRAYIHDFAVEREIQPGVYTLNDFNFKKPRVSLRGQTDHSHPHAQGDFEIYDYPGEYEEPAQGQDYSQLRLQELHAGYEVARGQVSDRSMAAGTTFTLADHPRAEWNRQYLITSTSIHLAVDPYQSGGGGEDTYSCSFTAIPASVPYRSPRLTPKPLIQGPQTAIVTGPAGDEIHTDKYGRIKVQFHWDRYGKADENSSCWVRISQAAWAGKKWGGIYIPRVGQEVVVEHLEGDPDLPIVTGRVYNADTMPPYDLPAEKTKTTLKSNSSKGGQGFNEFRFEDKKGAEQIFVHAERNHDLRVKLNSFETVGNNRHLVVKKDQFESVTGDKHQEVQGEHNQKIGETLSIDAGQNIQEHAGMNIGAEAGTEIHLKAGMNIVLEAGLSITLKAGGGFIVIGPSGVTISGTPVLINSGGSAGSGSGISPTPPKPALEADNAQPGTDIQSPRTPARKKPTTYGPAATVLKQAAKNGTPFCEQCAKAAAAAAAAAHNGSSQTADTAPVKPTDLPRPPDGGYGQGQGPGLG